MDFNYYHTQVFLYSYSRIETKFTRSDWFSKIDLANWIALALAIFFLIISVIIGLISATYITRPLRSMAEGMKRITNLEIAYKSSGKQSRYLFFFFF